MYNKDNDFKWAVIFALLLLLFMTGDIWWKRCKAAEPEPTVVNCGSINNILRTCLKEPICCRLIGQGIEKGSNCEIYIYEGTIEPVCVRP